MVKIICIDTFDDKRKLYLVDFLHKNFIDIFSFEINLGTVLVICKHARDGWGV